MDGSGPVVLGSCRHLPQASHATHTSSASSFAFTSPAAAMAFIPAINLGLLAIPVAIALFINYTHHSGGSVGEYDKELYGDCGSDPDCERGMGLDEASGIALILLSTFSPMGTLAASSVQLVLPHWLVGQGQPLDTPPVLD